MKAEVISKAADLKYRVSDILNVAVRFNARSNGETIRVASATAEIHEIDIQLSLTRHAVFNGSLPCVKTHGYIQNVADATGNPIFETVSGFNE